MQRWDYFAEVTPLVLLIVDPPRREQTKEEPCNSLSNNNILNPKPQPPIVTPTTKYVDHMQMIDLLIHPGDDASACASGLVVKSNVAIVRPRVRSRLAQCTGA